MKIKNGFTLSEILITLGIVGIVAAMTIPNLINKIQEHRTVTKLKATYSILSQAIKLAGEEVGYPEEWGITGRNAKSSAIAAEKLKPYLKILTDCGMPNNGKIASDKCFPQEMSALNGTICQSYQNSKYYVSLMNGTSVAIEGEDCRANICMYFLIDVNGIAPPNTWGIDIFEFSYNPSVGLVPSGHPQNSSNTYKTFCKNKNSKGWGCAYYVLNFGKMDYLKKK